SRRDQLTFFHELIQEYYAALELCSMYEEDPTVLLRYQNDAWWKEILILFFGLVPNKAKALERISARNLALSAKCVMDASSPDPELQASVVTQAAETLK